MHACEHPPVQVIVDSARLDVMIGSCNVTGNARGMKVSEGFGKPTMDWSTVSYGAKLLDNKGQVTTSVGLTILDFW